MSGNKIISWTIQVASDNILQILDMDHLIIFWYTLLYLEKKKPHGMVNCKFLKDLHQLDILNSECLPVQQLKSAINRVSTRYSEII